MTSISKDKVPSVEPQSSSYLSDARVLIVDDSPENIGVLVGLLSQDVADLQVCTSGQEALDVVAEHRPDIVLLDVRMPGMDGFETCRRMKAMDGLAELPVIFLTAETEAASVGEGFSVGGVDYVTKPFDKDVLRARLIAHLQRTRLPRAQADEERERLLDSPEILEALAATSIFEGMDHALLRPLANEMSMVTLTGGKPLIRQGEYGTAIYVLLSGRLNVSATGEDGEEQSIAEIGRGEVVGEISILTGGLTTANVTAIRDSNLIQISKAVFGRFKDEHPAVLENVNRVLINRINKRNTGVGSRVEARRQTTVALVPAHAGTQVAAFAEQLAQVLGEHGSVRRLSADLVDDHLGANHAQAPDNGELHRSLATFLNRQEADHNFVIYEADRKPSAWTSRCLRHADRVLIVAHAGSDSAPGAIETDLRLSPNTARRELVLLHPRDTVLPSGTSAWLAARDLESHHHVRLGDTQHMERLGRILAGRAIGLVLSGGSARGYAHLGILRALKEQAIPLDFIGGTSSGAGIAAHWALGQSYEEILAFHTKWVAEEKAMFRYTLPLMSLAEDRHYCAGLRAAYGENRIEDLWINCFAVSANLTKAALHIHRDGLIWEAIRATTSMPAYFSPFCHEGDLLIDGGVINNLPIDVMREFCDGFVIASDVSTGDALDPYTTDYHERTGWQMLVNRINPFAKRIKAPSMAETISRMIEVSRASANWNENTDADFDLCPPVKSFSWFDPKPMREIAEAGYVHACERIAHWKGEDAIPFSGV
jgi:predicted acylesterase/phospholipase RssA/CheY-like chemotaxis protein/CRP-like cAMP-binding protein